jgi:regulator of replication initiation timing
VIIVNPWIIGGVELNFFRSSKNLIDHIPDKVRDFLIKSNKDGRSVNDQIVLVNEPGISRSIITNDRPSQDLLSEVERFIKDREVLQLTNLEMKGQLEHFEQRVALLAAEKDKYIYQFLDKEEEIKGIEESLTQKHLIYDQLVEEYKKLQAITSSEINELKSEIEIEQHKYFLLGQELKEFRDSATKEQDALQERVRRLEAKNGELKEQVQSKIEENAELMRGINKFSEQFTFTSLNNSSKKEKPKQQGKGNKPAEVVEEAELVEE